MNAGKNYLRMFYLLIEEYSIEMFIFEALVLILVFRSFTSIKYIITAIPASIFVSEAMKLVINAHRPTAAMDRSYFRKNKTRLIRRSFPSTHSAVVVAFAAIFYATPAFIPLLIFAVIVMHSRIYLKAHYLRDIIAGGALGYLIGYSITILI